MPTPSPINMPITPPANTQVNTRNQFQGTVYRVRRGSVVSEVELQTTVGLISAVVTTSSLDRLELQVGDDAVALFKATDVLVAKLPPATTGIPT